MPQDILVLVHPGSMCGSARAQLGRMEADAAREMVMMEVGDHDGGLVIVDGAFSDELSAPDLATIDKALAQAADHGEVALRVWGDDSGETPWSGWQGAGDPALRVHDGQEEAARAFAPLLAGYRVRVTGAWASHGTVGCVNSVVDALRAGLGHEADIAMSETAVFEPDAEMELEEDDLEP